MILIRHGQSLFNLHYGATRTDPGIADPELTETGRIQARAAAAALRERPPKRLIASPYARALQTAEIIADALGLAISVEPLVRERAVFTCDVGSPPALLAARWPALSFDHLAACWWSEREESEAALAARCDSFRAAMAASPDWSETGVVSHWAFIRGLTGQAIANGAVIRFDPTLSDGTTRAARLPG